MSRVTLGDVATERRETCKADKSRYPVVGLEHMTPEEIALTAWDESGENTFTKMFHKGDMLFGRRRAYLKKAAIAPFDGICSGDITVIEAKPDYILPELLPFVIQNDAFFDFAVGKSAGSLSPRAKWEHLKDYEFKLPSMDEQRKLAKALWAINGTIEAYKKLLSATDELVKSQFIEMFGDPMDNPMGWDVCSLDSLSKKITDGVHKKPVYTDDGIRFISVMNINKGFVDFSDCKYVSEEAYQQMIKSTYPEKGDVLYTKVGATYGIPAYVDTDIPFGLYVSVCLIKPDHTKIDARFLTESMRLDYVKKQADDRIKGIGVPDLHLQEIREFKILCPTRSMQEQYVAFVAQSDKSKFELERALAAAKATYKSIISNRLGADF